MTKHGAAALTVIGAVRLLTIGAFVATSDVRDASAQLQLFRPRTAVLDSLKARSWT